jgi:DNA polymerase (family 10)
MSEPNKFTNLAIAELLRDIAAAYQVKAEKNVIFKIPAYNKAADAIEHLSSEIKDVWDEGKLDDIPGVGPSIAEHLNELFTKGKSHHFESVMEGLPKSMFALMKVQGIGPKRAYKIAKELKVSEKDPYGDLVRLPRDRKISACVSSPIPSSSAILPSFTSLLGN